MATNKDTLDKIKEYLNDSYTKTETTVIPKKSDLTFWNTVKTIKHAKVFYIDMRKSRKILSDATDFWSVKIHKAFLKAVTDSIEKREGHIRSFNWDWILAFFVWDNAASKAVKAALDIKWFVREINEILEKNKKNKIDFGIGIAQGPIMVAKSWKSWDDQTKQDLIWIGIALYVAVELSEIGKTERNIWISHLIRSAISEEDHLNVVSDKNWDSIWVQYEKELKSVGSYDIRSTTFYSVIK